MADQEVDLHAVRKEYKAGDVILNEGDEIKSVPLLAEGSIRIVRPGDHHEVYLYHLLPGETCAIAMQCCQANHKSTIKAIAETDCVVYHIPNKQVEEWQRFPQWRNYIFETYSRRFEELLEVIDLIAFGQKDHELLNYLERRARASGNRTLNITHREIAEELHTSREVISRLLRVMDSKGFVRLGRNTIEVL